jgi:hypothetical protein
LLEAPHIAPVPPPATHWIVTGNFTDDGAVAWRRADGTWSRRIAEAGLVDEPTAKALAAAAIAHEQRELCDPYGVEVRVDGDTIDPLTARQRIRAHGPTVRIRRPDGGLAR